MPHGEVKNRAVENVVAPAHFAGPAHGVNFSALRIPGAPSALTLLVIFLALDQFRLLVPIDSPVVPWNPGLGVCVAAGLIWGRRALILAFAGPIISYLVFPGDPEGIWSGALSGLANTATTAAIIYGAEALRARASPHLLKNPVVTILLVSLPAAMIVCAFHAVALGLVGPLTPEQIAPSLLRIWIGDVSAVIIVTPLLAYHLVPGPRRDFSITHLPEALALAAVVISAVWFAFGIYPQNASRYLFIVLIPMIWIVLRSGIRGAIAMNALVQVSMVISVLVARHVDVNLALFQALLLVLSASSLIFGLAVDQSRAATLQLRAREEELAANLRVAATGELAGTLAHELGHPLGAISNYAAALNHVLRRVAPGNPDATAIGAKLSQEIVRATDTLHRLRDFFRTGALSVEHTDLGAIVKEAVLLLKDRFGHNAISPHIVIQPGANAIMADRIQLRAVVYNLLVNAIDVLKPLPPDSRVLSVTVRRSDGTVMLEVEDSGGGVPVDVRENIFEPLVTTKKDGLGLGLSMSRSVVNAHGGTIVLMDSPLGGAKFVVMLPAEVPQEEKQ